MLLLSIAGLVHAFVTPKSKAFASFEPVRVEPDDKEFGDSVNRSLRHARQVHKGPAKAGRRVAR